MKPNYHVRNPLFVKSNILEANTNITLTSKVKISKPLPYMVVKNSIYWYYEEAHGQFTKVISSLKL